MAQTVTGRANFGGNSSVALNLRATTEPWRQSHRRTAAALTTSWLIILTVVPVLYFFTFCHSVAEVVHCICCIHSYIALFPLSYSLWLNCCWTFQFFYCLVIYYIFCTFHILHYIATFHYYIHCFVPFLLFILIVLLLNFYHYTFTLNPVFL